MIHLDANLLIALVRRNDAHHPVAAQVISKAALAAILTAGIVPFDAETAAFAGEIYHLTGSKRRTRLDTMIAATAIRCGAELATTDPDNFQAFLPCGLKLFRL